MSPQRRAYCLRCRYELTHLTRRRCPECGAAFDPGNLLSFRDAPAGLSPRQRILVKYDLVIAGLWALLFAVFLSPFLLAVAL